MRSGGLRVAATFLLLALVLPPISLLAQGQTMPMHDPDTGAPAVPQYGVTFAIAASPAPTASAGLTEFVVQCQGPCGGTKGPQLEFQMRETLDGEHVDRSYPSTSSATFMHGSDPVPWYNYSFALQLPRAHQPQFRVRLDEPDGRHLAGDWQAMPGIRGGVATFADAGTTTAYRGDAPRVKSTTQAYVADASLYRADPDGWDNNSTSDGGAPQTYTWNLARAGSFPAAITHASDVVAANLAPTLTTLTREGCLDYTVTVSDAAGEANEGAAYRADALDAFFDPTAAPALQGSPATYTVEHLCVANHVPSFATSFLPDPGDQANGVLVFGAVRDLDYDRGYDKLVFTVYDHQSRTAPGAQVLGTWDWSDLSADSLLHLPLAALVDGGSVCVMDHERDAIVGGQLLHDVANLLEPICAAFQKTPSPGLPRAPVTRLIVEAGTLDRTWVTSSGALRDTHRSLPFDPAHPGAVVPALTGISPTCRRTTRSTACCRRWRRAASSSSCRRASPPRCRS
jgi:hypothetical protein